MKKLTQEEKAGAEQFYSYLQTSLSGMETSDEFLADTILAVRKYIRDKFIKFIEVSK